MLRTGETQSLPAVHRKSKQDSKQYFRMSKNRFEIRIQKMSIQRFLFITRKNKTKAEIQSC